MILFLTLVAGAVLAAAIAHTARGPTPFTTAPTATNGGRLRRYERLTEALRHDETMLRRQVHGFRVISHQLDRDAAQSRHRKHPRRRLQSVAN